MTRHDKARNKRRGEGRENYVRNGDINFDALKLDGHTTNVLRYRGPLGGRSMMFGNYLVGERNKIPLRMNTQNLHTAIERTPLKQIKHFFFPLRYVCHGALMCGR